MEWSGETNRKDKSEDRVQIANDATLRNFVNGQIERIENMLEDLTEI